MSDRPIPDRVSVDPSSPFYEYDCDIEVTLDGVVIGRPAGVYEACVSQGWVRVEVVDDAGNPLIDHTTWRPFVVTEIKRGVVTMRRRPAAFHRLNLAPPAYTPRSTELLVRYRALLLEYGIAPTALVDRQQAAALERLEADIRAGTL